MTITLSHLPIHLILTFWENVALFGELLFQNLPQKVILTHIDVFCYLATSRLGPLGLSFFDTKSRTMILGNEAKIKTHYTLDKSANRYFRRVGQKTEEKKMQTRKVKRKLSKQPITINRLRTSNCVNYATFFYFFAPKSSICWGSAALHRSRYPGWRGM